MSTCLNELLVLKLPLSSFWLMRLLFNWCLKLFFKKVGIAFNYSSNQGWDTSALLLSNRAWVTRSGYGSQSWYLTKMQGRKRLCPPTSARIIFHIILFFQVQFFATFPNLFLTYIREWPYVPLELFFLTPYAATGSGTHGSRVATPRGTF